MHFKVRAATKEDCKEISRMIKEFAVYEKMPEEVQTSQKDLERDGFCQDPFFECLVAEVPEENRSKEAKSIGKGLLCKVAEMGKKKQCVLMKFIISDWNTPSKDFYAAKSAQDITDSQGWHFTCFDKQNLDNLANEAPKD